MVCLRLLDVLPIGWVDVFRGVFVLGCRDGCWVRLVGCLLVTFNFRARAARCGHCGCWKVWLGLLLPSLKL